MLHLLEQLFMCLRPTHAVMKLRGLRGSKSLPADQGEVRWGSSGFAIFTTEKVPTKPINRVGSDVGEHVSARPAPLESRYSRNVQKDGTRRLSRRAPSAIALDL